MAAGKLHPRDTDEEHGGVDDMTKLTYLNEPGVLFNLARRYAHNEIYVREFCFIRFSSHLCIFFFGVKSCISHQLCPHFALIVALATLKVTSCRKLGTSSLRQYVPPHFCSNEFYCWPWFLIFLAVWQSICS